MKLSSDLLVAKGILACLLLMTPASEGKDTGPYLKGDRRGLRKGRYLKARSAEETAEGYILKYIANYEGDVEAGCTSLLKALPSGATIGHTFHKKFIGFDGCSLHGITKEDAMGLLDGNQAIAAMVENTKVYRTSVKSWGQDRVDQRNLPLNNQYNPSFDGSGVDVYILDDGMRPDHVEYADRLIERKDFTVPPDFKYNDHGTHVAGTAVGKTVGVAPKANVYDIRALAEEGGETEWVVAAIQWAVSNAQSTGRRSVINMSIGGPPDHLEGDAIQAATEGGIVVVVAAGNEDQDACNSTPANALAAVTVGASNINDERADFSNWGSSCVQIHAPGVGIYSAVSASTTSYASEDWDGTSMASPHVAGAAALILQANPGAPAYNVGAGLLSIASTGKLSTSASGGLKNAPNTLLYVGSIAAGMTLPGPACVNTNGWRDSEGDGCQWYQDNNSCGEAADWANNGVDAKAACCTCGGGAAGTSFTSGVTPTSGTGWRTRATASGVSRGQGQYWDVRELEFYSSPDCTSGKVDISSGTITVSGTASGSQYVASNAFDGNDSTFWGGRKSGSTFYIGIQGLSEVTVNCVTVNQKNADKIFVDLLSSGSWIEVGEFENLSDGTTDLIVDDSATSAPTPAPVQGGTPTSGTGWRIESTAAGVSRGQGQYWDVRELEFYTSADCTTGKVDSSTGSITVSGTASGSQYVASNAFDGNDSTFWGGRKSGSTFWIGLQGLSEVTVKCITVNQKNADTITVKVLSSGSWVEVGEFTGLADGTTDLIVDHSGTPTPTPTSGTGWRIKSTAAGVSRGQGQYWDVRELGFFTSADCINGKVDTSTGSITVSGTASGSQYVASNAFDGNSGTFWGGRKSGSTFWIGVQGLSEVAVKCVTVDQKNADTIAVEVLSSGSWVEVEEFDQLTDGITDLVVDDSGTPTTPVSGTGWRIETTPAGVSRGQGQYWDVKELAFYTSDDCTTGKVDSSTGTITVSGTANGNQYVASNSFDGNDSTFWGGRNSGGAFWIGLEGLSDVAVKCVVVDQKNADSLSVKVKISGAWIEVGSVSGLTDGITEIV